MCVCIGYDMMYPPAFNNDNGSSTIIPLKHPFIILYRGSSIVTFDYKRAECDELAQKTAPITSKAQENPELPRLSVPNTLPLNMAIEIYILRFANRSMAICDFH